jgi:hypothetical protein
MMIDSLKEVEFPERRVCLTKINVNTTMLGPQTEVPSDGGIKMLKAYIYIYVYMHVRSANPDPVKRQQNMEHVKII